MHHSKVEMDIHTLSQVSITLRRQVSPNRDPSSTSAAVLATALSYFVYSRCKVCPALAEGDEILRQPAAHRLPAQSRPPGQPPVRGR